MQQTLVKNLAEIEENVSTLRACENGSDEDKKFLRGRIKNGKLFVAMKDSEGFQFSPSKFAGYSKNSRSKHIKYLDDRDGRETTKVITTLVGHPIDVGHSLYDTIDHMFLKFCSDIDVDPSKHHRARRYWVFEKNRKSEDQSKVFYQPEELSAESELPEGAAQVVLVNRWERNREARKKCIKHYGSICQVCDLNFEAVYGEIGRGYIHVHHVIPISKVRKEYNVDPIQDLRPVCPNCHAMLHVGGTTRCIEELRELIRKNRSEHG